MYESIPVLFALGLFSAVCAAASFRMAAKGCPWFVSWRAKKRAAQR